MPKRKAERSQKGEAAMREPVSDAIRNMIHFYTKQSQVPLHDISHFMKVWGFSRAIGLAEGLSPETLQTLELAAIVHDIACPLCRKKYGNTNGRAQEAEGESLAREFYDGFGLSEKCLQRVVWLVAHHHTYEKTDGPDYQILLEADFLVNAEESQMSRAAIASFRDRVFRTETGLRMLRQMYLPEEG